MRKDWLFICAVAAFMLQSPVFGDAVIEIRAVSVNGTPVTPTTSLSVNPGDEVEAEITLLPGFGDVLPTGIRSSQVNLAGRVGATSGGNDRVLPFGWDAPLDTVPCADSSECPFGFLCIRPQGSPLGKCQGGSHFPDLGVDIDKTRTDYLLFGRDALAFVGTETLDYVFGSLDQNEGGQVDDGSEFYLGTFTLEVGPFACGTFSFSGITSGLGGSSILVAPDNSISVTPSFVPLELDTGACGPIPTDALAICSIDARYPHAPESVTPSFVGGSFELSFDVNPVGLSASDFAAPFTVPPTFPNPPTITSVQVQRSSATITLSSDFEMGKWTCIRHIDTNRTFCRAVLPGDSDQSQLVEIADLDALLVNLDPPAIVNGEPYVPLALPACDIDRSGRCSPIDLLGSINLLGGAQTFFPGFLGDSQSGVCPGVPVP